MRGLLIYLVSLVFCQAVAAQENISARVIWYGIYTVSKSREIDDPTSPTGQRYKSIPEKPASNTDQIPGKEGLHFGLSYVLSGNIGSSITIKQLYRFPPGGMPDPYHGGTRSFLERIRDVEVGEPLLMGWSFKDSPSEQILIGDWIFEVWQADHKIVERKFMVSRP
jgi:hypothetical protein